MNRLPTKKVTKTKTLLLAAAEEIKHFSFKYGWLQETENIRMIECHQRTRISKMKLYKNPGDINRIKRNELKIEDMKENIKREKSRMIINSKVNPHSIFA